jgi:rhodanese-related sulfurtransferase
MLTGSPRPFLLDVRTPEDINKGMSAAQRLIPLDELAAKQKHPQRPGGDLHLCFWEPQQPATVN